METTSSQITPLDSIAQSSSFQRQFRKARHTYHTRESIDQLKKLASFMFVVVYVNLDEASSKPPRPFIMR